jgi:hypothetical protein
MFDESSSPAFVKIDQDKFGSCYAILEHANIPAEFHPKVTLQADSFKDMDWEDAQMEIALIAIPTIALIPYGKEIKSTTHNENFINEMKAILSELQFWAQMMKEVVDQYKVNNHTDTGLTRMLKSVPASISCNPARAATKGLRGMTFVSSPFVNQSLLGRCTDSFETDQAKLREFLRRNPTLARVNDDDDDDDEEKDQVPVHSTTAPSKHQFPTGNSPPEFYAQLIETMTNIQAPQQPTKIVVESRDMKRPSIS